MGKIMEFSHILLFLIVIVVCPCIADDQTGTTNMIIDDNYDLKVVSDESLLQRISLVQESIGKAAEQIESAALIRENHQALQRKRAYNVEYNKTKTPYEKDLIIQNLKTTISEMKAEETRLERKVALSREELRLKNAQENMEATKRLAEEKIDRESHGSKIVQLNQAMRRMAIKKEAEALKRVNSLQSKLNKEDAAMKKLRNSAISEREALEEEFRHRQEQLQKAMNETSQSKEKTEFKLKLLRAEMQRKLNKIKSSMQKHFNDELAKKESEFEEAESKLTSKKTKSSDTNALKLQLLKEQAELNEKTKNVANEETKLASKESEIDEKSLANSKELDKLEKLKDSLKNEEKLLHQQQKESNSQSADENNTTKSRLLKLQHSLNQGQKLLNSEESKLASKQQQVEEKSETNSNESKKNETLRDLLMKKEIKLKTEEATLNNEKHQLAVEAKELERQESDDDSTENVSQKEKLENDFKEKLDSLREALKLEEKQYKLTLENRLTREEKALDSKERKEKLQFHAEKQAFEDSIHSKESQIAAEAKKADANKETKKQELNKWNERFKILLRVCHGVEHEDTLAINALSNAIMVQNTLKALSEETEEVARNSKHSMMRMTAEHQARRLSRLFFMANARATKIDVRARRIHKIWVALEGTNVCSKGTVKMFIKELHLTKSNIGQIVNSIALESSQSILQQKGTQRLIKASLNKFNKIQQKATTADSRIDKDIELIKLTATSNNVLEKKIRNTLMNKDLLNTITPNHTSTTMDDDIEFKQAMASDIRPLDWTSKYKLY